MVSPPVGGPRQRRAQGPAPIPERSFVTPLSAGSYYGKVLRRREVRGFTFTESAYAPGTSVPRHAHENAYLCAVLQGGYTELYGTEERAYGAAAVVLHPRGEPHSDRFHHEGGRCLNIELSPGRLSALEAHPIASGAAAHVPAGSARWLVTRLYREFTARDSAAALALEGLALELLAETARHAERSAGSSAPLWLNHVQDLLHEQFRESLSLEEIAVTAGVHPTHLARAFRRSFHCTVGQYIRRLRIDQARRLLASGEQSLCEIALDCGFYDHSQFTRTFREVTGMAPSEYRRSCRR
jgi:AraC family transcriptional regulator